MRGTEDKVIKRMMRGSLGLSIQCNCGRVLAVKKALAGVHPELNEYYCACGCMYLYAAVERPA